jgi:hypothetical protein
VRTADMTALAAVLAAAMGLVPLSRELRENWVSVHIVSALVQQKTAVRFWRGAGLRSDDEELGLLLAQAYQAPADTAGCQEAEKHGLADALPGWVRSAGAPGRMTVLARVRDLACRDRTADGLRSLEETTTLGTFDLQRVALLRRQGADDAAAEIVLDRVCPRRESWCVWSVSGRSDVGGSATNDEVWRSSGGPADTSRASDLRVSDPLEPQVSPNVAVVRNAPLVVAGPDPRSLGDNYVEYETLTATGPTVRFRVRGAVFGTAKAGCTVLRLVFWASKTFRGEVGRQYTVKGRFEVELWATLPGDITSVTPRLTFDRACFSDGQRMAVGAADLAFGSPAR